MEILRKGVTKLWVYDNNTNELYHYGRKGMKWGQHIFGKVKTASSNARAKIAEKRTAKKAAKAAEVLRKKPISKLTDAELKARTERMKKEKDLIDLERSINPKNVSAGKQFIAKFAKDAIGESVINVGKTMITNALKKRFGIDAEDVTNSLEVVAKKGLKGMTDAEINKLGKRAENVKEAKKQFGIKDDSDDSDDTSDSKSKSSDDGGTSAKTKSGDDGGSKSDNSGKTKDDNTVHEGKVSGKGSSKGSRKKKNNKTKSGKPDGYYDPIDTDFVDRDTPVSNMSTDLIAYGRRRISGLLSG